MNQRVQSLLVGRQSSGRAYLARPVATVRRACRFLSLNASARIIVMRHAGLTVGLVTLFFALAAGVLVGRMGGGGSDSVILFPEGLPPRSTVEPATPVVSPSPQASPVALDFGDLPASPAATLDTSAPLPMGTAAAATPIPVGTVHQPLRLPH